MRPLSSCLMIAVATSATALAAAPDAAAAGRGGGFSGGARSGGVSFSGGGFRGGGLGWGGYAGRYGFRQRSGFGQFGRRGRDGFGRDGFRGACGRGAYGCAFSGGFYGYGFGLGYSPYGFPSGPQGGPTNGANFAPGLPASAGIRPPPVQPPAIYVLGGPSRSAARSVSVRRGGGAMADSAGASEESGVVSSDPRLIRAR